MKQELLKKINPIIEKCVDDVLASFGSIEDIRKESIHQKNLYENLIEEKEKEVYKIKKDRTTQKKEHDERMTEFSNKQESLLQQTKVYEDLTQEIENQKQSIDSDTELIRLDLLRAKEAKSEAENNKTDVDKLKKDYENKVFSLKADFEKIAKDEKELEEEKKKLKRDRSEFDSKEAKYYENKKNLNNQELRIKVERKEINRLTERYKLQNKLKEA